MEGQQQAREIALNLAERLELFDSPAERRSGIASTLRPLSGEAVGIRLRVEGRATFSALDAMHPQAAERQELAAAGVAPDVIDALYPPAYGHLALGALIHLRTDGFRHLYGLRQGLSSHADAVDDLAKTSGLPLLERWLEPVGLGEGFALGQYIYEGFGETSEADGIREDFITSLRGAWLLMRHRGEVPADYKSATDLLAWWVAARMLPTLTRGRS